MRVSSVGSIESMTETFRALAAACRAMQQQGRPFALVGGLAVSVRAEARFTRDVDLAVVAVDDADAESLIFAMSQAGYQTVATVEHEVHQRLATVRLRSHDGIPVDLLFASSGIEREIVERAERITVPDVGPVRVARAEELLAMKLLSMSPRRLQDRLDAQNLIQFHPGISLDDVRDNLRRITARGYHRNRDLLALLDELLHGLASG
jgi:predicted nucleotidyltransferase